MPILAKTDGEVREERETAGGPKQRYHQRHQETSARQISRRVESRRPFAAVDAFRQRDNERQGHRHYEKER